MIATALPNAHAHTQTGDVTSPHFFARVQSWLETSLCALHGHDWMLHFGPAGRVCLHCVTCGHETPGWRTR